MSEPLVSVIMPAYNAENYIDTAIRSILNQTLTDWELLIVDDASTDRTYEIARSYRDCRVKVIRNEVNKGPGFSRNTAMLIARGKYIAVLDADDAYKPERLERLLSEIRFSNDIFVSDLLTMCFDKQGILVPWRTVRLSKLRNFKDKTTVGLKEYLDAGGPGIKPIFPRALVLESKLSFCNLRFGEDLDFWIQLFNAGLRLRIVSDSYYLYRISPGSLSASISGDVMSILDKWANAASTSLEERQAFLRLKERILSLIRYEDFARNLKSGRIGAALRMALRYLDVAIRLFQRTPEIVSSRLLAVREGVKLR